MSKNFRIAIISAVLLISGVILFLPQLQNLFGIAGANEVEVTENILVALQEAEKQNKPVFLDFYGEFWQTCREMKPVVQALAKKYGDKITFIVADVQTTDGQILAQQFNVDLIPTFYVIRGGNTLFQHTGFIEKEQLEKAIKKVYDSL